MLVFQHTFGSENIVVAKKVINKQTNSKQDATFSLDFYFRKYNSLKIIYQKDRKIFNVLFFYPVTFYNFSSIYLPFFTYVLVVNV